MNQLILSGVTLNDLLEQVGQIIESKLRQFAPHNTKEQSEKFFTRYEVARLLKISLPTLHDYTKLGWLQSYKIGNRVLYKQEEVIACVDRVLTNKYKRGGNHVA